MQEAKSHIEGGATPAFKGEGILKGVAGLLGDVENVDGAQTGGEERLVGITPSCVHDQTAWVFSDSFGECSRTLISVRYDCVSQTEDTVRKADSSTNLLQDNLSPATLARKGGIKLLVAVRRVGQCSRNDFVSKLWLSDLASDRAAVDGKVGQVGQHLLSSVLAAYEREKRWRVIDKGSPGCASHERRVRQHTEEELKDIFSFRLYQDVERMTHRNVGLDTADAELNKSSQHLSPGHFEGSSATSDLDQQTVIVGLHQDGTSDPETHACSLRADVL